MSVTGWLKAHHWIHTWTRWVQYTAEVTRPFSSTSITCQIQARTCEQCGLTQTRTL